MRRGPARPIKILDDGPRPGRPINFSVYGPRPGPADNIFEVSRPGPGNFSKFDPAHDIFEVSRPGLAHHIFKILGPARPGPAHHNFQIAGPPAHDVPLKYSIVHAAKNFQHFPNPQVHIRWTAQL